VVKERAVSQSAAQALEAVVYGAVAVTARALATVGLELTFGQWRVLVIVGERPEGATVSDIATRIGSELSPASRLVSRMARRGLVTLVKDEHDRRVTRVTLTKDGKTLRKTVLQRRLALLGEVLAGVAVLSPEIIDELQRIGAAFGPFS
jgi:DNA-binding MarR family transcriptional regulator